MLKLRLALLTSLFCTANLYGDLQMDFLSPGSHVVGNYFISPYTAKITDWNETIKIYCNDFNHEIDPPTTWYANIYSITNADMPNVLYGSVANSLHKYTQLAWLYTQLAATNDLHEQGIYQYAGWEIFLDAGHSAALNASISVASILYPNFASEITAALSASDTAANSFDPSGWRIVSPNPNRNITQEFLTPVPEPSSIVLLATLFFCIALMIWREQRPSRSRACDRGKGETP